MFDLLKRLSFIPVMLALFACEYRSPAVITDTQKPQLGQYDIALEQLDEKAFAKDLIGGEPADLRNYPAVVYSRQGSARCTATVVGPKALLIAAHCVANNATAYFKVQGKDYSAKCSISSSYPHDSTADWGLCAVSRVVEGIQYEVLSQELGDVKVGDRILLTGYGCIHPRRPDGTGGDGGNDGVYRVGEAIVSQVPSPGSNDIVTNLGSSLCFGDSGGPAFKKLSADGFVRRLLSVNSRGDIRTTSFLVSIATDDAKSFLHAWIRKTGLAICGVSKDAQGCRP